MISNTAEYALRAIVHLASFPDQAATSQHIAAGTKVPAGYMSKVLQDLGRAGLVVSQRGPKGGFTLARPPEEITLLDVVNAVDPIQRIRVCPLGLPSHGTRLCALHQRLDDAMAHIERVFTESSIAELMGPSRTGTRCMFPTLDGGELPAASASESAS